MTEPEKYLPYCKWIKVSFNAGTRETYSVVHGVKPGEFDKTIYNIIDYIIYRNDNKLKCSLGMQAILLPENKDELELLASNIKDIGVDYLVVKPYSQHPLSGKSVGTVEPNDQRERALKLSDDKFKVIWRDNAMSKIGNERGYKECLGMPFWTYIDAGGNVWGCSNFLGDERFRFGNLNDDSFTDIWAARKKPEFDLSECRDACRMDECNRYLWELKHPHEHVNFI
ncbi:MAG: SPASM domain-containing protein [Magnetococcus sp. WYHC-3]